MVSFSTSHLTEGNAQCAPTFLITRKLQTYDQRTSPFNTQAICFGKFWAPPFSRSINPGDHTQRRVNKMTNGPPRVGWYFIWERQAQASWRTFSSIISEERIGTNGPEFRTLDFTCWPKTRRPNLSSSLEEIGSLSLSSLAEGLGH